ncbi:MAG: type III pantothenate kinase [Mycoplasma sp.]
MILIIDIGNTYLKASIYNKNQEIIFEDQIRTKETNNLFFKKFNEKAKVEQCYIGSVAPSVNNKVEKQIIKELKIKPKFLEVKDFVDVLDLKKFDLNEIGIDIVGFAYYLRKQQKKAIGICYGTALFSVGVDNKKVLGAIIVPYIERGIKSTVEKTELIKLNRVQYDPLYFEYGTNTHDALLSGINHVYEGLTTNICSYFYKKYKFSKLCITGGNQIKIHLNDDYKDKYDVYHVHNAVIKGYAEFIFDKQK